MYEMLDSITKKNNYNVDDEMRKVINESKESLIVTNKIPLGLSPINGSSRVSELSIPVRCFGSDKLVTILPIYIYTDMLEGKVYLNFDKENVCLYKNTTISTPLKVNNLNIEETKKYVVKDVTINVEELEISNQLKNINILRNLYVTRDRMTNGNKTQSVLSGQKTLLYIDKQLGFPSCSNDENLYYVINDTLAAGTRAKWIYDDIEDRFKGTIHTYVSCVTAKDISQEDHMRNQYFYIQIKRKAYHDNMDLIVCTSKLFNISCYYYKD